MVRLRKANKSKKAEEPVDPPPVIPAPASQEESIASSVPSPVPAFVGSGDDTAPNRDDLLLLEDLPQEEGQQREGAGEEGAPAANGQPKRGRPSRHRIQLRSTFPCPICNRIFNNRSGLLNHEGIHENPRPFLCVDCPKGYPTEYLLMKHERKHFRNRPYRCPDCPRKFLWKNFLMRHVRDLHSGVKAYSCDVCGESFHFAINAYMHKKKGHNDQGRKDTLRKK